MADKILTSKQNFQVPKESIGQFLFQNAAKHTGKVCQIDHDSGKSETFESIKARSTRLALNLRSKGVSQQDVIAFCSSNNLDNLVSILAAYYLGAIVTFVEPRLAVRQMQNILRITRPKIIFVQETAVSQIESSLSEVDLKPEVIVYGSSEKYQIVSNLILPHAEEDNFRPVDVDFEEICIILFSSGTTGSPKAICHTHKSFLYMAYLSKEYDWGERIVHSSPYYWITASMMLLTAFAQGSCLIILNTSDPQSVFQAVEKYKVTSLLISTIFINTIVTCPNLQKFDVTSLHFINFAGNILSLSLYHKFKKIFPNTVLISNYGMTEVGILTMFDYKTQRDFIETKPLSCGSICSGRKLKIVDPKTEEILGPNQRGEIRFFTESAFKTYGDSSIVNCFDEEGFIKTGDVGYYDEDKCLYVVSRMKEILDYQNWAVIPAELENILLEHPGVKEAAVVGIPVGIDGEAPLACVILKENTTVTEQELIDLVDCNVSEFERLRGGVVFLSEIPKTVTGKVRKGELRDIMLKSRSKK